MKRSISIVSMLILFLCSATIVAEENDSTVTHVYLQSQELEEIIAGSELYAYFGPVVCNLMQELPLVEKHIRETNRAADALSLLCDHMNKGYTTAPITLIEHALQEAGVFLESYQNTLSELDAARLMSAVQSYYTLFACGAYDVTIIGPNAYEHDDTIATRKTKSVCSLHVRRQLTAGCLNILHNATINGELTVHGDEVIQGDLTVLGTIHGNIPSSGCQPGPLTSGTSDATEFNLVTSCTERIVIDGAGAVTINTPTTGDALTVNGSIIFPVSDNILINSNASIGESNTLHIGTATGTGARELEAAFICGIEGVNVGSVAEVVTIDADQLGSATLTAGTGITITPTANTITIAATGGGSGITTINGDTGSATGAAVTLTGTGTGTTARFAATGSTVTFNASDVNNNTAFGTGASVSMTNGVAVGSNATSSLPNGVAVGFAATASGNIGGAIAIGADADALDANAIAIGFSARAVTSNTIAIGGASGSAGALASNISIGGVALAGLTSGDGENVAIGLQSLANATAAQYCITVGDHTLQDLDSGAYNVAIGNNAGLNYVGAESHNILINSSGVPGESNILRIGENTGTGTQELNATFISGITGITVVGAPVLVAANNQLGVAPSSARFKNDIQDMSDASSAVLSLRPVTFVYNKESALGLAQASDERQFGLIAEEVAAVMPELVILDEEGKPFTVKYHDLPALLLNEIKKLHARIEILENK